MDSDLSTFSITLMRTNLLIATLCLYAFVTPVQAGQLNNLLKSSSKSEPEPIETDNKWGTEDH